MEPIKFEGQNLTLNKPDRFSNINRKEIEMILFHSKKISWHWVTLKFENIGKPFYFKVSRVKNNHWLWRPRFFAYINLFLVSFWRDNSSLCFGVGFGKNHLVLRRHWN